MITYCSFSCVLVWRCVGKESSKVSGQPGPGRRVAVGGDAGVAAVLSRYVTLGIIYT